ncbi:MAG TPA: hypothetical protein PKW95_08400 [bacterium]|nr:hypothetical protein [bacterium]
MFLVLIFGVVFFACESGDGDDDETADDDSDEDDQLKNCMDVWTDFYECGWYSEDDIFRVSDIIALCDAGDQVYGNPDLIMCIKI